MKKAFQNLTKALHHEESNKFFSLLSIFSAFLASGTLIMVSWIDWTKAQTGGWWGVLHNAGISTMGMAAGPVWNYIASVFIGLFGISLLGAGILALIRFVTDK